MGPPLRAHHRRRIRRPPASKPWDSVYVSPAQHHSGFHSQEFFRKHAGEFPPFGKIKIEGKITKRTAGCGPFSLSGDVVANFFELNYKSTNPFKINLQHDALPQAVSNQTPVHK